MRIVHLRQGSHSGLVDLDRRSLGTPVKGGADASSHTLILS